jgi:tetratricopeptide (TPR) repeat protein
VPLQWADIQNNLGVALAALGARNGDGESQAKAVAAYRAALSERTRERVPLQWAATQVNLGNVLQQMGLRRRGAAELEQSIAAYRESLQELTRERSPRD